MKSIWTKTTEPGRRPPLQENIEADVCIIGGGMTGILSAYFLNKKGLDTVVLEARKIGDGQTKNTTAKITSQHGLIYRTLIEKFGKKKAEQYARLNQFAIEDYQRIIKEENIDCNFQRLPSYLYSLTDANVLRQESWAAETLGIPTQFVRETELPFRIAGALAFENQAQFHPMKFLQHLAKDVQVYEDTNALRLDEHEVFTKEHSVKAKSIIFATHFPFTNFPGFYFMKLHQQRSYVLALENAMSLTGMYYSADKKDQLSLRSYGDVLLLGGGAHRTGVVPQDDPYEKLRGQSAELWPDAKELDSWSAQDCMTMDNVPYIGKFSKSKPDWYVGTGYGKWGMTGSMVAARLLTDQIMGTSASEDTIFHPGRFKVFSSLPTLCRETAHTAKQFTKGLVGKAPRCAHLGCALEFNPYEKTWECPCHGSRFHEGGALIDNPAQEDVRNV